MHSILEISIISLFVGVTIINFPISTCSQSKVPVMPSHPQPPFCSAFPGSTEWNQCWDNYSQQMQAFGQQMQEYQTQVLNMSNSGNDGADSSILLNGYSIRAKGLSISSNSVNGQMNIQVFIGKPDNLTLNATEHKLHWDLVYPHNVTKFLVFEPPQNLKMTSIKHEVKDETILISGPTENTGSSSSSSVISNGNVVNVVG